MSSVILLLWGVNMPSLAALFGGETARCAALPVIRAYWWPQMKPTIAERQTPTPLLAYDYFDIDADSHSVFPPYAYLCVAAAPKKFFCMSSLNL